MGRHRRGSNSESGMRLLRRLEKNHDGIRSAATRQHYIQIYQAIKYLSLDIAEFIEKGPQLTGPPRVYNSIIKFFALDRLLPWVVAVSTDPARDSALLHPSSLGQSASYRNAIVRGLLRLVRLKLSSIPMGLERAPIAWRRPCFLANLHPLSALSWPPWTMRFARIRHTAACPPYSRSVWPFVSRPFG